MASLGHDRTSSDARPKASARASATDVPINRKGRRADPPRFGIMWEVMRTIGDISLPTFFSSVQVQGQHYAPSTNTPLIVCATHSNTILDVAMLASHMPERRPLHFWAKAGLFKNPIFNFILTSSGNIKVDRRNKNNQALFQGTFEAMKAGGGIGLFPEGGSYTIPALAKLKMGAAWAALEYARYLQMQASQQGDEKGKRRPVTDVKILPAAVIFDDKSVFRSRALLQFGKPISLDRYIDEFLSAPPLPEPVPTASDATVPSTPISMTRTNTDTSVATAATEHASPAHQAVARLTADLYQALEAMTFNAPDWPTFQAVRAARELIFELQPGSLKVAQYDMTKYVALSRSLMTLLTLDQSRTADANLKRKSKMARNSLFVYNSMLHLNDVQHVTLARMLRRYGDKMSALPALPQPKVACSGLWSAVKSFVVRLPYLIPIYLPTLIPMYIIPDKLAHHYAGREEESLSSVKTLFSVGFSIILYVLLLFEIMRYSRWSPPGLIVAIAALWWLAELNRSTIDTAYGLVKQIKFGWRVWRASKEATKKGLFADSALPSVKSPSTPLQAPFATKTGTANLFFYGTLVHPKILARVIGNSGSHLSVHNGVLPDAVLCHVKGQEYPGLIRSKSISEVFTAPAAAEILNNDRTVVKGTLVCGLTRQDLRCLDAFEGEEYTRTPVTVLLDPSAKDETNLQRIQRGGDDLPLHSILSSLTPDRITIQGSDRVQKVEAEVYTWTAGLHQLEPEIWEFDKFAREKASRWVGVRWNNFDEPVQQQDGDKVENEFEYEIVDRIRDAKDEPATATTETTAKRSDNEEGDDLEQITTSAIIDELSQDDEARVAMNLVVEHLAEKPSIQHYVNQAFKLASARRPSLSDPMLITALLRSRRHAKEQLESLLSDLASFEDEGVQTAIETTKDEKLRVVRDFLGASRAEESVDASWPFPPPSELKKDV